METTGIGGSGLREKLMRLYLELDAYPEVSGVIETLRKAGYATATLSNGSPKMLDAAVGSAGIPLDAVLSVEEVGIRSEEHTSELQSLMRISYAVFCLKKKT